MARLPTFGAMPQIPGFTYMNICHSPHNPLFTRKSPRYSFSPHSPQLTITHPMPCLPLKAVPELLLTHLPSRVHPTAGGRPAQWHASHTGSQPAGPADPQDGNRAGPFHDHSHGRRASHAFLLIACQRGSSGEAAARGDHRVWRRRRVSRRPPPLAAVRCRPSLTPLSFPLPPLSLPLPRTPVTRGERQ